MRRVVALLLVLVLTVGLIPIFAVAQAEDAAFAARYPQAIEIWEAIEEAEEEQQNHRNTNLSETVRAICSLVEASDTTEAGSVEWHGKAFFWRTVDGAACGYNPGFRERVKRTARGTDEKACAASARGGVTGSADVAVIQPYYGIDDDFTMQYPNEGNSIAETLGGTCTVYRTTDATIDNIAHALETCAVVIFDSHGDTDYYNGDDCVSYANTSYLCLQNGYGITEEDQQVAAGRYGRYYHAYYGGSYQGIHYYMVDGTAIANHMAQDAPNSLLWMAICLGMATDGICKALRDRGVETVYGYSQSVSFDGDYLYEESFFNAMKQGATVTSAISQMKREYGNWDPAYSNYSPTQVKYNYVAYPIVVSDEDPYPGQGKVDAVQNVYSRLRLGETELLYGDVNMDGTVDCSDASLLLRCCVGFESLTRAQMLRAEVNADCVVDTGDAAEILRYLVRLTRRFAVQP